MKTATTFRFSRENVDAVLPVVHTAAVRGSMCPEGQTVPTWSCH